MKTRPRLDPATLVLLAFVALVSCVHVWIAEHEPPPELWGDEPGYLYMAQEDALLDQRSLLPGRQRFEHQPALVARVDSWLWAPGLDDPAFVRRISLLQTALFAALLLVLHAQARVLGLGRWTALVPVALLGSFPWFGFHVHSLWPEVLHACLSGFAWLALLAHLRRPRAWLLLAAGLLLGYALLAKGTLQPFVPLAAAFVAWAAWRSHEGPRGARLRAAAGAAGLLLAGVAAVIGPQILANVRDGHGASLAANRWWNVELGLTLPAVGRAGTDEDPWELEQKRTARYFRAGATPEQREAQARERVLELVRERGWWSVATAQVEKLAALVLRGESCLDQSLDQRRRWGDPAPGWIAAARAPGRWAWYALVALGLAGTVLAARGVRPARGGAPRDLGRLFLAACVVLYWAEMLAVPVKIRFLLPLVPFLCLLAGVVVEELARSRTRRATEPA